MGGSAAKIDRTSIGERPQASLTPLMPCDGDQLVRLGSDADLCAAGAWSSSSTSRPGAGFAKSGNCWRRRLDRRVTRRSKCFPP